MWRHLKFIYFFSTIYLSQELHVDPLHEKFIDSIATMASHLVAQQKNLHAVAVVGTFCSSCELEREILRRVQSINQLPVIAIKHDSELVHQTTLTINPWKSEFIVFHVITYSLTIRNKILDLDKRNRKVFYVINKPFRGKPFLWDNVWVEMFFVLAYRKSYNINYIAFLNYQAYLFTRDKDYKEIEVTVEDDIVQNRLKYLSGNIINVAQYHNPPLSIIDNGRVYGYDGKFLDVICKLLNVSYKLETLSSKVGRLDDDLVLSTLIHVTSTLAHFSFNTREASQSSAVSSINSKLSGTYPLEIMRVCAVIPRSDKYSTIMNIIKVFDLLTWLTIAVVFIGIGLIFWLSIRGSSNLWDVYLSLWEIQLLGASTQRAALRWNKWLGILFVLYNFLILSFFSSDLVAFLTKPHFYKDIDTLEELNWTSLDIFMSTTIALEISAIRGKSYLFGSRTLVSGSFSFMVQEVMSRPFSGFITTENLFKLFMESEMNRDSSGEARYHVVKECYYNTYRNYLSSEGNPYEEKVNLYQSWVNEAGLFIHWMRFVNYDFGSADTKSFYKMTFKDFNVAFYILILGYILAMAVFIVEMIFSKIKKRFFKR